MADQTKMTVQAENIHLQYIKVVSGAINANPDLDVTQIKAFDISFETESGTNLEANITRIIFKVELTGIDQNNKPLDINAQYAIDFAFQIDDLTNYLVFKNEKTGETTLDGNLGTTLMAIVYSTTRGIVLTRTQGTILDGVILPILNPANLLAAKPAPIDR